MSVLQFLAIKKRTDYYKKIPTLLCTLTTTLLLHKDTSNLSLQIVVKK